MVGGNFWDYPEHSRYKHEILGKYLPTFRSITKDWQGFTYVDGFAGCGKYNNGNDGSPLLAIRKLNELYEARRLLPPNSSVTCIFVELDVDNFRQLRENLNNQHVNDNIHIKLYNDTFENAFEQIKNDFSSNLSKFPSLFFLDPFGYGQIPFNILEEIFKFKKPEIILTFMVNFISRFHSGAQQGNTLERLFGSRDWRQEFDRKYSDITDKDEAFSIFFQDLILKTNARHTIRYKIKSERSNRRLYDIIHATTHFKGLEVMKDIMFNIGIEGTFEFHGSKEEFLRNQRKITEFIDVDPDINALRKWLETFPGNTNSCYTYDELMELVYMETPYINRQLRECLKGMEKKGVISVERVTSKTMRGLSGKDKIYFN